MKKILWMNIMAMAAIAMFASGAMAQSASWIPSTSSASDQLSTAANVRVFRGVIRGMDEKNGAIFAKVGRRNLTFYWNEETIFNGADHKLTAKELWNGESVWVHYTIQHGRLIAREVDVRPSISFIGGRDWQHPVDVCTINCT